MGVSRTRGSGCVQVLTVFNCGIIVVHKLVIHKLKSQRALTCSQKEEKNEHLSSSMTIK